MAMHTAADPAVRYGLVTAVNDGLLAGEGTYATQVGVYTLNCTRADNVATLTFENTLAATPEPQATPDGTAPGGGRRQREEGSGRMMADKAKAGSVRAEQNASRFRFLPDFIHRRAFWQRR